MQKRTENQITALYCRLSQDDGVDMERNSIQTQRKILQEYVDKNRIRKTMFFADDGYSGTDFNRPDFRRMEAMVERGEIGTIIVKDLSRFARNYIEAGNYIEVKYPSMGVRFIAIQENIDTAEGTGIEMMPFYNIFNEWHAAQTSKKVREVFRVKAAEGKRVFCRPPYGYKRADDSEQWIIDEGAAKIVRRIFDMCLQGLSTGEIAKQLQSEKVLTPTCYWISEGRNTNCTPQENPYRWCNTTISHILKNLQYTGCAINFQTTTISYKVHDRIKNPQEEWQIIPNAQEAIIDDETFQRVKEIRDHRQRHTKTGKKSILTSRMFCGDCGSKMYFHAGRKLQDGSEHFRCSRYKTYGDRCTNHYARESVMRELVIETIRKVADYVTNFEPVFLYLYAKKNSEATMRNMRATRSRVEKAKKRITELNTLIMKVYEDHVLGSLSEERYSMMAESYENEQKNLKQQLEVDEAALTKAEQSTTDLKAFLRAIRQFTEIEEIDEKTINTLISKIEVFERVIIDGKRHLPVKIHFTAVGIIDVPTEKEILRVMEEIRNNSKPNKSA